MLELTNARIAIVVEAPVGRRHKYVVGDVQVSARPWRASGPRAAARLSAPIGRTVTDA
jgi:hypothetical protein